MPTEVLKKGAETLTSPQGANNTFLAKWVSRNEVTFSSVMERLADELPQKYAELYIRCMQIAQSAPQRQPSSAGNNVNIQINKLDTLSDMTDTSWRRKGSKSKAFDTPYEEIK